MKKLDICLSTDDNYAKYAAVVIKSAQENKNSDEELVFHILHSHLEHDNMERLKQCGNVIFHKIDNSLFEPYFNNGVCKNVTIPTLYRLMLPSLLPEVNRILYLDCDLIVLDSLSYLFNTELSPAQYAACVEDMGANLHMARMGFEQKPENFYFNAGVCLLDLEKMRRDNIEKKMFDYLKENYEHLSYSDQDVMNATLLGHVKKMERKYNFITINFYFSNDLHPSIAHFAGVKPWKIGFYNIYREKFWEYFMQTPFADDKKQIRTKNMVHFMHNRLCQIFWHIKMYPCFFLKENRRTDLMRIIKNIEYKG